MRTISPASPLPSVTDAVTIDGYSQLGSSPNTVTKGTDANLLVELGGSNAEGESVDGLVITWMPRPTKTENEGVRLARRASSWSLGL